MKTCISARFFMLMATVQLCRTKTSENKFSLVASSPSVFGHVGKDIVLPCALSANISAEGMEIRWLKKEKQNSVIIFISQENNENELNKIYQGRTELLREGVRKGNVSLLLKSVTISDQGNYTCSVITSEWFSDASLTLNVIATGSTPLISLDGHQGAGIGLSCISFGWLPFPQVEWLDGTYKDISVRSNTEFLMDQDGLYSVNSHLEVSPEDSDGIICRVGGVQRQSETYIEIKEELFQTFRAWKSAFVVILLFLLLTLGLLGVAAVYWMKKRGQVTTAKLEESEKMLLEEKERCIKNLESEFAKIKEDIEDLKKHLENTKSESRKLKQDCSDLNAIIKNRGYIPSQELEEMRSVKVNLTISQIKSSKNVKVSEDGKKVRAKTTKLRGWDCAIANESFTAGRHYWEVKVGDIHKWRLGVTSDSDFSEVKDKTKAWKNYWELKWKDKKFIAVNVEQEMELTTKQRASVIGVFLDYDKSELSFYNLDETSRIHTWTFSTEMPLYPFFNCASPDRDLVILPQLANEMEKAQTDDTTAYSP
ncbi:butyrophilin subfamily 3 member A2-like [Polypterus senegalus]|uniref:butyrophilin subfamily 3 member A2-like n=1 Tax=Polypterus senegalus TaxID=55291 RepID=UPI001963D605|nr:butyrophilin subfamily 3 member A2-like [Polypterus senegalus]XP_039597462.1 butyrophilin subfamily 3 member A2-like [Polypterus senegalus]